MLNKTPPVVLVRFLPPIGWIARKLRGHDHRPFVAPSHVPSLGRSLTFSICTILFLDGDYWGDSSFASFILAETFATPTDLVRTGMGAPPTEGLTPS